MINKFLKSIESENRKSLMLTSSAEINEDTLISVFSEINGYKRIVIVDSKKRNLETSKPYFLVSSLNEECLTALLPINGVLVESTRNILALTPDIIIFREPLDQSNLEQFVHAFTVGYGCLATTKYSHEDLKEEIHKINPFIYDVFLDLGIIK